MIIINERILKPIIMPIGTIIKIDNHYQEFPTEEEAYEFYKERKTDNE